MAAHGDMYVGAETPTFSCAVRHQKPTATSIANHAVSTAVGVQIHFAEAGPRECGRWANGRTSRAYVGVRLLVVPCRVERHVVPCHTVQCCAVICSTVLC
jgi:hypothetical protein